ncbi:sigma-70 family RNA polymerase sigma factor [Intrasporangium sp. YIM S08009]|uniref:RNA polymerase sigma factor n=1 Tax=Intrasporangium zincisolvens TaxID=3080018 RepID=UPI002B060510|nr:sigma-70 family RNA polymerase sigma factor [Intrasporangium sp. YIM S08009]
MTGVTGVTGATTEHAFAAVFDANAARLVRFAAFLGAEDAEDVVQEAFCRLYARRDSFDGEVRQAGAYLNRTVLNLVRDRGRRHVRTVRVLRLHHREAERVVPSVESLSLASDEGRRLVAALGHLPRRRREAVTLRFWLDLSYSEIADAMGTSVGAAKSAVSRGIDDLHRHLEQP